MNSPTSLARNKFIAIEGIDGVGKSTIVDGLASRLRSEGHPVRTFSGLCHPFQNLRNEIHEIRGVYSRYLFYLASNAAISAFVRENTLNEWIICDRYVYTTQAYHIARGIKYPIALQDLDIELPHHTFWIRLPDEDARQRRILARGPLSRDDHLVRTGTGILDRVESIYQQYGLIPIDNSDSDPQTAVRQILSIVLADGLRD